MRPRLGDALPGTDRGGWNTGGIEAASSRTKFKVVILLSGTPISEMGVVLVEGDTYGRIKKGAPTNFAT